MTTSARTILIGVLLLVAAGPAVADDRDDVRTDIQAVSERMSRLTVEMQQIDREIQQLRMQHETAGHPRIVLERHVASVAHLDRRLAQARKDRAATEHKAGWGRKGWDRIASIALWVGLGDETSWYSADLKRTAQALKAAQAARDSADAAFVNRLQSGVRVAPVRPSDWVQYPLGRPNDVFAVSIEALERSADKGDLEQASLAHRIQLLQSLRGDRERRRTQAADRLRQLGIQERGYAVPDRQLDPQPPVVRPTPVAPPTRVETVRYQGGLSAGLQAGLRAGWEQACRQVGAVAVGDSLRSTPLVMEIRRTPEGERAVFLQTSRLSMTLTARGQIVETGHVEVVFAFEEGRGNADGVLRGKVKTTSIIRPPSTSGGGEQRPNPVTMEWVARPKDPQRGTYAIYLKGLNLENGTVPAFELRRVGR